MSHERCLRSLASVRPPNDRCQVVSINGGSRAGLGSGGALGGGRARAPAAPLVVTGPWGGGVPGRSSPSLLPGRLPCYWVGLRDIISRMHSPRDSRLQACGLHPAPMLFPRHSLSLSPSLLGAPPGYPWPPVASAPGEGGSSPLSSARHPPAPRDAHTWGRPAPISSRTYVPRPGVRRVCPPRAVAWPGAAWADGGPALVHGVRGPSLLGQQLPAAGRGPGTRCA